MRGVGRINPEGFVETIVHSQLSVRLYFSFIIFVPVCLLLLTFLFYVSVHGQAGCIVVKLSGAH
jgi:hypothetical protein